MRIDRLSELVSLLRRHGPLSARELAAYLGVSTRTIERDIDALARAGVPLRVLRGRSGGISLAEESGAPRERWRALALLTPEAARLADEAGLTALPDGRLLVSREFSDYGEMLGWAWALGDGARVLEPEALRADILRRASRLVETYGP